MPAANSTSYTIAGFMLRREIICKFNLFGEEKTEKIAKSVGYSYHGLVWKVQDEKFKKKFGILLVPLFIGVVIIFFIISIYLKTRY